MDDEQEARLGGLFREAASGAPPPRFDAGQVVATSRRITRRRRSAVAGAALAVLAVAGVGVTAGLGGGSGAEQTTAAAGSAAAADAAAPEAAVPEAPEAARAAAPANPLGAPGGSARQDAAPLGPGTGECADRQDPALRALLEQALPEVAGAPAAVTTQECRPGGERGLALEVDGGLVSVTYLPPGTIVSNPQGSRTAETASGGTVVLTSRPDRAGGPQPFADRLDGTVRFLATRL